MSGALPARERLPIVSGLRGVERVARAEDAADRFLHVWWVDVHPLGDLAARFSRSLSWDERARARRFAHPRDRAFFTTCRGLVRSLLGVYLRRPARAIAIEYGANGKPALAGEGSRALAFNVSHSGNQLLVAVSGGAPVGVDVELVRDDIDHRTLVRQFFHPEEVAALESLTPSARRSAFFRCWTRKEAYLKARGDGLRLPLHRFGVTCPPHPAALLETPGMAAEASRWALLDLAADPRAHGRSRAGIARRPRYAAALAVERSAGRPVSRRWSP